MRDNTTFQKTFTICQYHLDFLEQKDPNASNALRHELDEVIENETKIIRKTIFDTSLTFVSFGIILLLFSYMLNDFVIKGACIAIGAFLFGYGAIGGINNILQTRK